MKPSTTINRLLALAAFMRKLPRSVFDMNCWIRDKSVTADEDEKHYKHHNYTKMPECGMAACLGGWATHVVPELVIKKGAVYNTRTRKVSDVAFADAFGISDDDAYRLTDGNALHRTPFKAAKAVEEVAAAIAKEHGYEIVNA